MEENQFSVILSVYGRDNPAWFALAVESIRNQTRMPAEIILVVDGPVPEELDQVISGYESLELFHVIRLEKNVGLGEARRIGLANCKTPLAAVMDADDLSVETRFARQMEAFEQDPRLSVVGGYIDEFITDPKAPVGRRVVPQSHEEICQYMKTRCPMNHVTVMFKTAEVNRAGGYMDWFWDEDYYLWVRMYLSGARFANLPEVLVNVRVGEDMYRRRGGWKYFSSEARLQKYMWKHRIIGLPTYILNVLKRLILQVLMPNWLRGWVFRRFARE